MKVCSVCGAKLQGQAQFCTNCGSTVKEEPSPANAPEMPVIPEPIKPIPQEPAKEEKPPRKKPSRKKVIVILCLTVLLIGLAVAAYFWLSWYFSPEQKVLRLLADGKYDQALELVEDERSLRRSDDLEEGLLKRLDTVKEAFLAGKAEYAAVTDELDTIEQMEVEKVNEKLPEYRQFVVDLNTSRTNFTAAEKFYNDGVYPDAIALYKLVIKDDSNYETAKTRITEATTKYRQAALAEAKTYADGGAYTNAIAVLAAALEVLPEDAELTSQKLLYEKDNLDQIKADALDEAASYAVSKDYETAMSVLDKYTAEYGADSEISVQRSEYLESYVDAVLAQVDKSQGEKDYPTALKTLDEGLKVAKDHSRLKNRREAVVKVYAEEICAQADTLVAEKKYDDALSLIDNALKTLPGNTTLTAKRTEVEGGMPQYLLIACPPYETKGYDSQKTYTLAGDQYANGFTLCDDYGGIAYFNLKKEYNTLSFLVGHIDGKNLNTGYYYFYLDGELVYTLTLEPSMLVKYVEIPINGASQLVIEGGNWGWCYALVEVRISK